MAEDRLINIMIGFDLGVAITIVVIGIVALIVIKKGE